MAKDNCQFDCCGVGRPRAIRDDEEYLVNSFFQVQNGDRSPSRDARSFINQQQSASRNHYPDNQELLDYDYPPTPDQKVTVLTQDALDMDSRSTTRKASSRFRPTLPRARSAPTTHKEVGVPTNIQYTTKTRWHSFHNDNNNTSRWKKYKQNLRGYVEEDSTPFGDLPNSAVASNYLESPSRRGGSQPKLYRQHAPNIDFNEKDDLTILGGLQFVSETGAIKPLFPIDESSQAVSHDTQYPVSQSDRSSPIMMEELPPDEYDVTLARDDYSRASGLSRFGQMKQHRLPSQRRAHNFSLIERRRTRMLRGLCACILISAVAMGLFTYFEFIAKRQNLTYTGSEAADASQSNSGMRATNPPTTEFFVPGRSAEEVEEMKNSEAFSILAPVVENPALLLDPNTAQGKAFDLIYQQTTAISEDSGDGRGLQTEFQEYRMVQRFSLMVIYFSTDGGGWKSNIGWRIFERQECEWYGVECYNRRRIATSLTLSQNGLVGEIPSELCLLKELESLSLDQNQLYGSAPECLAKMSKLNHIDLHQNDFSSTLPNEFFLSHSLRSIDLSENKFSGVIDVPAMDTDVKGFRSYNGFKTIKLNDNQLSGEIDDIFMFFTGLERLTLHNNNLVGGIDVMCIHPLIELTVDCSKVTCTCCSQCY